MAPPSKKRKTDQTAPVKSTTPAEPKVTKKPGEITTSLADGRNGAPYNKARKIYRISVTLESDQPFTIIPTTLKEGLFQNRKVILLNKDPPPDKPSRLLSLPPELRTKILQHLFASRTPVMWVQGTKEYNLSARYDYDPAKGYTCQKALRVNAPVAIFSTCQQMRAEACPMFYGNIKFRFDSSFCLKNFLNQIGSSIPYLRDILLTAWRDVDINYCTTLLTGAVHLKKFRTKAIEWGPTTMYGPGPMMLVFKLPRYSRADADSGWPIIAARYGSLLKSLAESGKKIDEIFAIVRFEDEKRFSGKCTCCKIHKEGECQCEAAREAFKAWLKTIKTKAKEWLAKELDTEEDACGEEEDDYSYLEPDLAPPRRDTGRPRRHTANISYLERA